MIGTSLDDILGDIQLSVVTLPHSCTSMFGTAGGDSDRKKRIEK